jgi:hypothetical protein
MIEIPPETIPLIVGVTGHRQIDPLYEPQVRSAFVSVLSAVQAKYPHCAIVVLTALAAGADSIAAEEALARKLPLVACLPFTPEVYERDFAGEDLARFRHLLASAARVRVERRADRDRSYLAAGRYIAHHCHLLVALWDGNEARGVAGTASIVDARLGHVDVKTLADERAIDLGPVVEIATPRPDAPVAVPGAIAVRYPLRYSGDRCSERDFDASLERLERYQRDLALLSASESEDPVERTDRAANHLQQRTLFWQRVLFAIAFSAAIVQVVSGVELLKLGALSLAFVTYLVARRNDFETRYQDYRALAEGLRVQAAWFAAGLADESVDGSYLGMQQSELSWIAMALRAHFVVAKKEGRDEAVFRRWLWGQWRYYVTSVRRNIRNLALSDRIPRILLIVAAVVSVALTATAWAGSIGPVQVPSETLGRIASIALTIGLLIYTLAGAYANQRGYASTLKRSERMFLLFDRALRELTVIERHGVGSRTSLARKLGREALVEHAEWLLAQRDRPSQILPGG